MGKGPKKEDFVHFHVHSDMSQLDGCGKVVDYVKETERREAPALALTEHGTMRGYYQQLIECQKHNVKPIYGIEFYVAHDMRRKGLTPDERDDITKGLKRADHKSAIREYEERHGIRDRWHLTVWAKNKVGLRNLFKLSTASYLEGYYYKPRIDLEELFSHGEGLAVATGCLSSPVNDLLVAGRKKRALEIAESLRERFGEDLWLEVQPHALEEQVKANRFALELRERWGKHARLLATQDAHYVHQGDHDAHDVLLCIGTGADKDDPNRFRFDGDEYHYRTRREMWRAFRRYHSALSKKHVKEALDSTMVLNEQVDEGIIEIDRFKCLVPEIELPREFSGRPFEFTKHLCLKGWSWRDIPRRARARADRLGVPYDSALAEYKERLMRELRAIEKQKFTGYFLLTWDLYEWVRGQGIVCGPGRGSAAGSIVAWLLGITSVDPIEHGLLFERFISPNRVDMPDIDMDFEDVRRQEIIEHLRQKWGEDKVCQIATVGKLLGKQTLKDVGRTLRVPYADVNAVTNSIIERSSGDERASQTIEDSFKDFQVCREFNERYPDVLKYARRLEGMAKNLGIHAAGVITSPVPLSDMVPLETRKYEGRDIVVSAIDMYGVQAMGLLKLDVLGLRTLTVLRDATEAIAERTSERIDLEKLELNDKKVLKGFTDHDYAGIFQYDSPGADKICSGVKFVKFEDVAAMTALNRPGTARSGLATQYVERKKNPKLVSKTAFHPAVSEITKDTLGIIVYQEHVLKIFTQVAGFEPGTADSLRSKIAKKWGDETIGRERENFIKGAMKTTPGMDEKTAGKIMDAITFFGSYGFNKSHATCYGVIAYWGMYLKTYYPLQFYWALLKNEPARIRIQQLAKDAKRHNIELLPPDVSASGDAFTIDYDANAIRGSLVDIKGVGQAAATAIQAAKPYSSLRDFLERVDRRKVHKGVVAALAKAGALDALLPNPRWFIENVDEWWPKLAKKASEAGAWTELQASRKEPHYDPEERLLVASSVSPLAFGKHPIDAYAEFIERHVRVPIVSMSEDGFWKRWDGQSVWIAGVIVEVKYNQIGDFHTGTLPSEEERERMFWGARYANVNVEDAGGVQNRIKFDIDVFDEMRELIDSGIGTPVVVFAAANGKYENLRAHFAVDLERYRRRVRAGESLNIWERILDGKHPTKTYPWKSGDYAYRRRNGRLRRVKRAANRIGNLAFFDRATSYFVGLVTNVKLKIDKRGQEMAFFGLLGGDLRYIDVVCFGSVWCSEAKKAIRPGHHIKIPLEPQTDRRGQQYIFNGGSVKRLKKSASAPRRA